ncbi:MAG TPA: pyridoxamine 5'-phosphate oxidase family protein [Cyclobacteriaceae bacterium]|nr:pyridoxamine 5'-phosphate oxidase family protein [Cyclobacteriaceae bacterium]
METYVEKLKELTSKCKVCMLGTFEEMRVRFRPMAHVDVDEMGNFWFFTSMESDKTSQINSNPNVYLTYACEGDSTYLSVEGIASVSNINRDRMKELFNPFVKAWFPDGLDDPNLALMIVHPLEIDYWVNNESKVLTYIKMLSSAVTGNRVEVGEHGRMVR